MLKTFNNVKFAFLAGGLFFIGLLAFSPRSADLTTNTTNETAVYDEGFYGQVISVAGFYCPRNYIECDGRILPVNNNTALFSLLGTTYGGDGRTTFGIPDLRNRTVVGIGTRLGSNVDVKSGEKGGTEYIAPASANEANLVTTTGTLGMRYCICIQGEFPARD